MKKYSDETIMRIKLERAQTIIKTSQRLTTRAKVLELTIDQSKLKPNNPLDDLLADCIASTPAGETIASIKEMVADLDFFVNHFNDPVSPEELTATEYNEYR